VEKHKMRLYEYEAKAIFRKFGIPVPQGWVSNTPVETREIVAKLNKPVALKAQLLIGGRGKNGGIRFAENPEEAESEAIQLFKTEIKGFKIAKLLVEEKLNIAKELYLGVTIDNAYGTPVVMASSEGGVEIEEIAAQSPEKIAVLHPNILKGVREYEIRMLVKQIGISRSALPEVTNILHKLYHIFRVYDGEIVEINPLVITSDGRVVAADARLNIDDHALFRHPELEALRMERFENPLELEGQRRGVNFVDLKGNVAVMGNGAGLVMTLLDAVKMAGGQPACFLDTGGGLSAERIENALDLLLMKAGSDQDVKAIFFAFWFMISPAEEVTEGFLNIMNKNNPQIPIIGVIQGIGASRAVETLEKAGIKCYPTIKEGVEAAVR
ncbi:MAG: ATP-grasp domain-containing protein, partial [Candidatus Bathyarchaeia archaeon]